jgi:alanyl-tRNA synthetase
MLTPNQLRQAYLDFMAGKLAADSRLGLAAVAMRPHAIVPSSPLVPENDPTTLFTGSGMQPMMPYLLGEKHPKGVRIADSQKCFRAEDIEEVGDNRHTTFFEMLGNWSLGDYFKAEQLPWFFTFLTDIVGLEPHRLYVTVFGGNAEIGVERDDESVAIWQRLFKEVGIDAKAITDAPEKGMQGGRIFFYGEKKNWWSRAGAPANMPEGEPGGPDSEMFYDFGSELKLHESSAFKDEPCHVNCDCGRFLEIGNSVFMKYRKTNGAFVPLTQQNVDFGGGLERIMAARQGTRDVFETAFFSPVMAKLSELCGIQYSYSEPDQKASFRVIADHVRAAVMLISDGVFPANKEQGYVVRRLIRRSVRHAKLLGIEQNFMAELVTPLVELYQEAYPELTARKDSIMTAVTEEEAKFQRTIAKGLKEFEKAPPVAESEGKTYLSGDLSFKLYETYGFPLELSIEEANTRGILVPETIQADFQTAKVSHQDKSRSATAGKFKGGLQDQSVVTTKYHTATHLLHAALRQVLGTHVGQKGSNITVERLRFDFSHPSAITPEQLVEIESLVNGWIKTDYPVTKAMMQKTAALESGAMAFFVEKYPDEVSVYTVGNPDEKWISRELCGGPHVTHTGEIGAIKIVKEKAISAGIRRIYAELV